MNKFLGGRKIVLLIFVVGIIVVMAVYSTVNQGSASPMANAFGILLSPFRNAGAAISGFFDGIYGYMYEYEQLKYDNDTLRARIAKMEEEVRTSRQALEENERLRKLADLSERRRDFKFVMANIVSRSSSNWESTISISKGTLHGISVFDSVINEEGFLVGYVSEVGTNWAIISTIIDSGTQLGALIYRTSGTAVAEGDFELMGEGKLKLTYLPENDVLLNGDIILTSGIGGMFPDNLVIGKVEQVKSEEGGMGEYAMVTPSADLSALTQVYIITEFDISE